MAIGAVTNYVMFCSTCESFILSPKSSSNDSLITTPLKSIQNIATPKLVERKLSGDGKNMSHGDIRCFIQPNASSTPYSIIMEGQSRRNRSTKSQAKSSYTSSVYFNLPVASNVAATQSGGFFMESQHIDNTQTGKDANEPIVIDDETVIFIAPHTQAARQELITDMSVCHGDFNPVMASTQIVDFRKPNELASYSLATLAAHQTDESSVRNVDRNLLSSLVLPTPLTSKCRNSLMDSHIMEQGEITVYSSKVIENEPLFVLPLKFDLKSCCEEVTVDESKSMFEVAGYRPDSPDLFDNDDVNTEDINAVLKELSASQYKSSDVVTTLKQEQRDQCLGKIASDVSRCCCDKASSDAEPSLASKLVHRSTALKQQNTPSPQLVATDSNSTPLTSRGCALKSADSNQRGTSLINDVIDGRRRSTRMKRKKRPFDQVQLQAKHRTFGVDFLDEMDQVRHS